MRCYLYLLLSLLALLTVACDPPEQTVSSVNPNDWAARRATLPADTTLASGATYLSSYSQIYTETEHRLFDLTGTISIRNINLRDTVYITRAAYFGTGGQLVRDYFQDPIHLGPMETVSIIIDMRDRTGGTGDNFYFEWSTPRDVHEPLFEGVYISTYGQQGLSFSTRGVRVE
ncbi:hypothetical protein LEM8419_00485 [Neolewinella maritima]|uniref:DUF3124 domain-containing protein n=1 Tax=Neolewinella maritima TaxID=1383882 RepID=A0ABN8F0C1_9BACT|nr:DUF3124 domain-containing protein [Neolewinella maritima]CAH0999188.1 hypothetical protein LEM8419_00485 [Neolewinella maritima]